MNDYIIKFAIGIDNLPQCKKLRKDIFIDEQKFENEFDDIDKTAIHILLLINDTPIATARAFIYDEDKKIYKIGRVCVSKEYRNMGVGSAMLKNMEEHLKESGCKEIMLSSQVRAKSFYAKQDYIAVGNEYLDEYCKHQDMVKKL